MYGGCASGSLCAACTALACFTTALRTRSTSFPSSRFCNAALPAAWDLLQGRPLDSTYPQVNTLAYLQVYIR